MKKIILLALLLSSWATIHAQMSFSRSNITNIKAELNLQSIAIGDLNGDGKLDFVSS